MTFDDDDNDAAAGDPLSGPQQMAISEISLLSRHAGDRFHLFMTDTGMMLLGLDPDEAGGVAGDIPAHEVERIRASDDFTKIPIIEDEDAVHEESYVRTDQIALVWEEEGTTHFCLADPRIEFETTLSLEQVMKNVNTTFTRVIIENKYTGWLSDDYPEFLHAPEPGEDADHKPRVN